MNIPHVSLNQIDCEPNKVLQNSSKNILQFKALVQNTYEERDQTNKTNWNKRAITYLKQIDTYLDKKIPDNGIQLSLDAIGNTLEELFTPLKPFNEWLDRQEQGTWLQKLALFLLKLPLRSVRNVIRLLYNVIKGAIYAVVHPLKAVNRLAKMLLALIQELTKPEISAKMGIGMMGASLGQAVISGNPLSVISLGIGAALLIGGFSMTAIKAAIDSERGDRYEAVKKKKYCLTKQLPEVALTGFLMGLFLGSVERIVKLAYMPSDEKIRECVMSFVKKHNLPEPSYIEWQGWQKFTGGRGPINFGWNLKKLQTLKESHPQLFTGDYVRSISMRLCPDSGHFTIHKAKFYQPDSIKLIPESGWVAGTHPSLKPPYNGPPVEFPTFFRKPNLLKWLESMVTTTLLP